MSLSKRKPDTKLISKQRSIFLETMTFNKYSRYNACLPWAGNKSPLPDSLNFAKKSWIWGFKTVKYEIISRIEKYILMVHSTFGQSKNPTFHNYFFKLLHNIRNIWKQTTWKLDQSYTNSNKKRKMRTMSSRR